MYMVITSLIFFWLLSSIFIWGMVSIAVRPPKGWYEYMLLTGWPVLLVWFCYDWVRRKL